MKSLKSALLLACCMLAALPALVAQASADPALYTCVWNNVPVKDAPGKTGANTSVIQFGEAVEFMGDKAYLPEEKRTYIRIRTADGKTGWVHEYLTIPGGSPAVVLGEGVIYKRPATPSTITATRFEAGELVVLEATAGEWISLIGLERKKAGWIQGLDLISTDVRDIELCALMNQARSEKDPLRRTERMQAIAGLAQDARSPLAASFAAQADEARRLPPAPVYADAPARPAPAQLAPVQQEPAARSVSRSAVLPAVAPPAQPALRTQRMIDESTGTEIAYIFETGGAYEVKGPDQPRSVYYAYHKSLPIGSTVRIQVPGNSGFVDLQVVNRLRSDNPNVVGLSRECMEALFGSRSPGQVTIFYPAELIQP